MCQKCGQAHDRRPPRHIHFPPDEEWLEMRRSPQYLVSTHGRCYTMVRRRLLIAGWVSRGDSPPCLCWRIGPRTARRLVYCAHEILIAFGPPRPSPFYVASPIDGERSNIRLDNLEWRPRITAEQCREAGRANARRFA